MTLLVNISSCLRLEVIGFLGHQIDPKVIRVRVYVNVYKFHNIDQKLLIRNLIQQCPIFSSES